MPLTKVPGTLIADSSITSADILDSTITNAKMAVNPANASNLSSGDVPLAQLDNVPDPNLSPALDDIALLAFKTQANGNLARYNLVDQSVDAFEDASGVDTSTSVDEIRDSSGKYYSGSGLELANYWGDSSDGALTTSGNVTWTVPNKVGSYDGDMVLKQFSTLTIASGHTVTVDQPNRGMFIYVAGDCTIAGTLTMTNKGGASDPTASGGSDSNTVGASGLQVGLKITGGATTSFTNDGTGFNGAGTGIRTAIANQTDLSATYPGTIYSIPRDGGIGGTASWTGAVTYDGVVGGTVSNGSGGGGQGGGSFSSSTPSTSGDYANGGLGGVFGGGSGGGSMSGSGGNTAAAVEASNAADYGGTGGNGVQDTGHGSSCAEGGAGNPSGTGMCAGGACSPCNVAAIAGSSGGGIIWLLVKGDLTITGTISANGSQNARGATANNHGAGSSGGGVVNTFYAGTLSNSGSITVAGGGAQSGTGAHKNGGAGGAGSTQSAQVLLNQNAYNNMTLESNSITAEAAPTKGDLVLTYTDGAGTAVVGTNITAEYSADAGSTWTDFGIAAGDVQGTTGGHTIVTKTNVPLTTTSGTSMRYRIKTLVQSVALQTRIHAVSLGWS